MGPPLRLPFVHFQSQGAAESGPDATVNLLKDLVLSRSATPTPVVRSLRVDESDMETTMKLTLCVLLLSLLPAVPASAKPSRHGATSYFPAHDVLVIREYYAPRYRSLPPGLAKKFQRTGHLPPGWQKKMQPLPFAVERQLVVLPPDYRRGYLDGAIVVYSPRSQSIVDAVSLFRQ